MRLAEAGDTELLAATARGDRDAFAALYDRHARAVYRYCRAKLRDPDAAADACQETFAAVWTGAARYAGSGAALAWILGIARRKAVDVLRAAAARAEGPLPEDEGAPQMRGPGHAAAVEEAVDVWSALARLPETQREVVLLTYGFGLSCQEAGEVLGVPTGTVKSRLHTARGTLTRSLGAPGGTRL